MEALLAILVQDTQILACMTYGNRGLVVQNQLADELADMPDDEQYHIPEGPKLLQIATVNNGDLGGSSGKVRRVLKGKKKGVVSVLKNILRGKKPGDATQDQVQGQEAGVAKEAGSAKVAGGATTDQDQLPEQEEGGAPREDQLREYALVEPGQDLWNLESIEDPVGLKQSTSYIIK